MNPISTTLMFDRAVSQMGVTQQRLARVQEQLATSKEVIQPSDAPDKAAAITRLKSAITRQESYADTISAVRDKLSQQETAIDSANDALIRMKELTIQAANDTNGPEGRKLINIEVRQLREHLLSLANTQDVNGNYIFAGSRTGATAYEAGPNGTAASPAYRGDQTVNSVPVGDERTVEDNRAATQPFARTIRTGADGEQQSVGFFDVIDDLSAALQNNDYANIRRAVSEVGDMQFGMSESLADIGGSMNTLDRQQELADANVLRLKETLSSVEDLDYTEAITKMNKDMLALQAAQSSFSKIAQMSLFTYIR